jgi:hypothetical protein
VSVSSLGEPLRGLDIQGSLTRSCPHSRGPAGGKDRVFLRAPSELWASWWSVWAAFWLAAPSPAVATTTPADDSHALARMLGKHLLNIVTQLECVPIVSRGESLSRLSPTGTAGGVGSRPTCGPVNVDYVWHPATSANPTSVWASMAAAYPKHSWPRPFLTSPSLVSKRLAGQHDATWAASRIVHHPRKAPRHARPAKGDWRLHETSVNKELEL